MKNVSVATSQLLSIPEVRHRLGGIGRTTVWRLVGDGQLQGVTIGARSFVLESSVEEFVARQSGPRSAGQD